jgi:uncharacterized protein YceH (UPF0502 family)
VTRWDKAEDIAGVLGVDREWLMTGEEASEHKAPADVESRLAELERKIAELTRQLAAREADERLWQTEQLRSGR